MRSPTPSERRLLLLLAGAVFLALNLGAIRLWLGYSKALSSSLSEAEAAISESQAWLLTAEAMGNDGQNLPSPPSFAEKDASSSLLKDIRASASSAGLSIQEEALPQSPPELPELATTVRLKVSGPFSGLVRFLFSAQQPGSWRSIEQMIVKAEASPQNVLAEMEIRQYYVAPPSDSGPAPEK